MRNRLIYAAAAGVIAGIVMHLYRTTPRGLLHFVEDLPLIYILVTLIEGQS